MPCAELVEDVAHRSAPDEAAEGAHQLLDLRLALLAARLGDAVAGVVVDQAEGDPVESGLDRADLGQDVDAVALLVDHPAYPPDLAFDPREALEQGVLVGAGIRPRACAQPSKYPQGVSRPGDQEPISRAARPAPLRLRQHLLGAGDHATAHQHPAADHGRLDDRAARGVDEVGGRSPSAELVGVAAQDQEVGAAPPARASPPPSSGARRAGRDLPGLLRLDRRGVAGGVALGEGERLEVGEQVERVVGAGAVGAEADRRRLSPAPPDRGRRRRPPASCWRPGC